MHHKEIHEPQWKEEDLPAFDEFILSWNATRPTEGRFLFYISVKIDDWSPWLLYASWGSEGQRSFHHTTEDNLVTIFQDTVEIMSQKKATGFQIKIIPENHASLDCIRSLHVYTNADKPEQIPQKISYPSPIYLQITGLSQISLNHNRYRDLCSPTSTTAAIRYLSKRDEIEPLIFAENARDQGFDIFGNWVFNVAQASSELGQEWQCWVERLSGFDEIYTYLHQGTPVVVSVRGPLNKSTLKYATGHLMVVIGYDPSEEQVICMDPAFPSDDQTHVRYELLDFIQAWSRRGNVAYVFNSTLYVF